MAGGRFEIIPEHIDGDGIASHGLGHANALVPVFPGNAGGVHFAADDLERFSIQQELGTAQRKTMGLRIGGGGGEQKQKAKK